MEHLNGYMKHKFDKSEYILLMFLFVVSKTNPLPKIKNIWILNIFFDSIIKSIILKRMAVITNILFLCFMHN